MVEYAIRIQNGTFTWKDDTDNNPALQEVNLDVKHEELIAVVGSVGSGKTSLISALLGDMLRMKGSAAVNVSCLPFINLSRYLLSLSHIRVHGSILYIICTSRN